jgi:hypothetical protein
MVMRLAFDISMIELAWAEWAREEVERWPDATEAADPARLRAVIATRLAHLQSMSSKRRPAN